MWHGNNASTRVRARDIRVEKKKLTSASILSIIIMVGEEAHFEAPDKSNWPKDFFDALVRLDWREWISAVKKEVDSWLAFGFYIEIPITEKTPGASIVSLGELCTRTRDNSYRYRQYLMVNLLKQGKDFAETFSSTVP